MKNSIYITTQDKQRLEDLLAETAVAEARYRGDLKSLAQELQRAVIVDPKQIPDDVITMNSRAEMIDLDTCEMITLTLVFPPEADIDEAKISVLAPIGAGMLGYRVGDKFEWSVPDGIRRMEVAKIHYQPEAAGDFHRSKAGLSRAARKFGKIGDRSLSVMVLKVNAEDAMSAK